MIAISGASGKTGCALVEALAAEGAPVRALVGREEQKAGMLRIGATEAEVGNLEDSASLERGLAGCDTLYHICPNMRVDEEAVGRRVLAACQRVGVERVVYHSVLHPQIEAMPHHWRKLQVERHLIESGLRFSILQPAAYMQNLRAQWGALEETGVLEIPFAPTTRITMVDLRDLAQAAARVLVERRHEAATYEICGGECFDQHEVAEVLGSVLGKSVRVESISREAWARRALEEGLAPSSVESLVAMFRHYETHDFRGNSRSLEALLERPPSGLETVASRWIE